MLNAFTVDFEDWYHGLEIDQSQWGRYADRLEIGCRRLLGLLEEADVQATFFVLGSAAERFPGLVREIHALGHEIGTHGHAHRFVYHLGPEEFREDIRRSTGILEELLGAKVVGHRAPYFSITERSEWAFDVLRECGIRFDSSVFPVHNYRYGMPQAPRWIHQIRDGLVEFPLSTYDLWGRNIPVAGGAYFRILPYTLTHFCLHRINGVGQPAVFYIHPWELDPEQPRLRLARRIALPHYWNLDVAEGRLRRLLSDFSFATMASVLDKSGAVRGRMEAVKVEQ